MLFSLGVDVYVKGNSTWVGLPMRACVPEFVAE